MIRFFSLLFSIIEDGSAEKLNSGRTWVPLNINILLKSQAEALNDEWRLNGPHSDCVTNKINIQNDFLKSGLLLSELQMIFLLNILSGWNQVKSLDCHCWQLWLMFGSFGHKVLLTPLNPNWAPSSCHRYNDFSFVIKHSNTIKVYCLHDRKCTSDKNSLC